VTQSSDEICFEKSFERLEVILERMNSGTASLDESLKLFQEADGLIKACNERLCKAESQVEALIKNRNGGLVLGQDQKPATTDFTAES
jgi:exodeoxyribonuclease VII small subunit